MTYRNLLSGIKIMMKVIASAIMVVASPIILVGFCFYIYYTEITAFIEGRRLSRELEADSKNLKVFLEHEKEHA